MAQLAPAQYILFYPNTIRVNNNLPLDWWLQGPGQPAARDRSYRPRDVHQLR